KRTTFWSESVPSSRGWYWTARTETTNVSPASWTAKLSTPTRFPATRTSNRPESSTAAPGAAEGTGIPWAPAEDARIAITPQARRTRGARRENARYRNIDEGAYHSAADPPAPPGVRGSATLALGSAVHPGVAAWSCHELNLPPQSRLRTRSRGSGA